VLSTPVGEKEREVSHPYWQAARRGLASKIRAVPEGGCECGKIQIMLDYGCAADSNKITEPSAFWLWTHSDAIGPELSLP
jgi:uncharacterized 2Fe-2S/4Fe-4S cluster protein (DUF4445 family)